MRLLCFLSLIFSICTILPAHAQVSSRTAEFQIINLLNQYRQRQKLSPVKLDRQASEVARQHSEEMAERNFFDLRSPTQGSIEYKLGYHRVCGRVLSSLIVLDYSIPEVFAQLQKNPQLLDENMTHTGVGIYLDDQAHPEKGIWLTLINLQYMGEFKSIPRNVSPGEVLRLQGEIYPPYQRARMPVTLPNGQVKTFPNLLGNRKGFLFEIPFNQGKGKYTLELLVDEPGSGPRVATILPVYAGQTYPTSEPSPNPAQENFATVLEASRRIFWLVNNERSRYHLPALQEDALLEQVAWAHSEDMGKNKYFAHINQRGEDPNDRFHKAGGKGLVGENIALDTSVEAAHQHLMNSPGHRANILDKNFTHLGVGVYFNGSQYSITQMFMRKNPVIDSNSLSLNILQWVNQHRRLYRVPSIKKDTKIQSAALQHSQAMAADLRLNYQAQGLNFKQRLQRQTKYTGEIDTVLILANSSDDVQSKLSKYKKLISKKKFRTVGIGVFQANSNDYGENSLWITIALGTLL
jgi:uncharacterized protein YkwD